MKKLSGKKRALLCVAALCLCAALAAFRYWLSKPQLDFRREEIVGATWWNYLDRGPSGHISLSDEEIEELITLLNGLPRSAFTENRSLAGAMDEYGILIDIEEERHVKVNWAGRLVIDYGKKQWWIEDPALSAFVLEKTTPTEERILYLY